MLIMLVSPQCRLIIDPAGSSGLREIGRGVMQVGYGYAA